MTDPGHSIHGEETARPGWTATGSFDVGSFELVRRFVDHVVSQNASARLGNVQASRRMIDWAAVQASVADSRTLEQAIGRAVVIADRMSRVQPDGTLHEDSPSSRKIENPFFAFSMADVIADFGDESRYRTRMARRVTSILGTRRTAVR